MELIQFLTVFLKKHEEEEEYAVDIVMGNMNLDKNGKIDKYNLTVFFLKLCSYDFLVEQEWIEKAIEFSPLYVCWKLISNLQTVKCYVASNSAVNWMRAYNHTDNCLFQLFQSIFHN